MAERGARGIRSQGRRAASPPEAGARRAILEFEFLSRIIAATQSMACRPHPRNALLRWLAGPPFRQPATGTISGLLRFARNDVPSARTYGALYPILIVAFADRRGASLRMSAARMATQPAVGVRPGRARWKKIALPAPFLRRVKL
jgi:hypothetical protein